MLQTKLVCCKCFPFASEYVIDHGLKGCIFLLCLKHWHVRVGPLRLYLSQTYLCKNKISLSKLNEDGFMHFSSSPYDGELNKEK